MIGSRFSDISIRRKLVTLVVVSTAIALLFATALIVSLNYLEMRRALANELETTATILAHTSTASLAFEDRGSAVRVLESLEAHPSVVAATLVDASGEPFARYRQPGFSEEIVDRGRYTAEGHVFDGPYLLVERSVQSVAGSLGSLYLQAELCELRAQMVRTIGIGVVIAILSCMGAVLLSSRFQRSLSQPILSLAELAGRISHADDHTIQTPRKTHDEIGMLEDALNDMLQRVEDRDAALERHREELEKKVEERTQELIRSQESLRRSERLAAVGTLAAGIAHQINNPIGSILNGAQLALMCEGEDDYVEQWRQTLRANEAEAKRCGRIVRSVLQFSRNEPTERWSEDLNEVVRRAMTLISAHAAEDLVHFSVAPTGEPIPVMVSPIEIEQVLVNVIGNAIQSIETPPGNVQISVFADEDLVKVAVTDDGCGIPPDQISRIFDPFFTTRLSVGGTGLGLSVAHAIVEDHGGTIEVESEPGKGSTFTISLPIHVEDA